ncbi:MAG: Ig-like domain repeat protein [Lachnospiraceae bacterium]|nr:Ig-like domain repeat protein [Lachnospiraceae bacterium]
MKKTVLKVAAAVMAVIITTVTVRIDNLYQVNAKEEKEITESVPNKEAKEQELIKEVLVSVSPTPEAASIVLDETSIALQREGIIYGKESLSFVAGIYKQNSNEAATVTNRTINRKSVWGGTEVTTANWGEDNKVLLEKKLPEDMQGMVKEIYEMTAYYDSAILDTKEVTVVWDYLAPVISLNYSQEELEELAKVRSDRVVLNYQAQDSQIQTENEETISGVGIERIIAEFESTRKDGYVPEKIETTSLNSLEINIEQGKEFHGICRLYAVDYLGNTSTPVEVSLNIDKAEPEITIIEGNSTEWEEEITIVAKMEDYQLSKETEGEADIWYVFENTKAESRENISLSKNLQESTEEKEVYDVVIKLSKAQYKDYSGKCTIYGRDKAGNQVAYQKESNQFEVNFDSTKPVFTDVTITDEKNNALEDICNKLSFGMFFKDKIRLEVQAKDVWVNGGASGIKAMVMYVDGVKYTPVSVIGDGADTCVVTFLMDAEKKTEKIIFAMEDKAGNKTEAGLAEINQSYSTSGIYIDKGVPYMVIEPIEEGLEIYQDKEKHNWYDGDVAFEIKAGDNLSGFEKIEVEINGKKITKDINGTTIQENTFQNECVTQKTFCISTSQGSSKKDEQGAETGKYDISITITDHSGNVTTKTKTVYVDETAPYIKGVEVKGEGRIEGNGTLTSSKKYEYFVKGDARLVVTAVDEKASAGIKSITYYTVNYAKDKQGVKSKEKTVSVDKNNQITIKLNSGFKGTVYMKATDYTKHSTENFEHPHFILTGTENNHIGNSAVAISLPKETGRDENSDPLYGDSVMADIHISDKDMGLAMVEWSVTSDQDTGNNTSGNLQIDKAGRVTENNVFTVTAEEKNLVTEMNGKISVKNDSNHIRIWVKITDRAGMTTEKEMFLSIDKQKPVVEVTYDNDNFNPEFAGEAKYFKDNRTATIVVKERNFDEKNVQIKITNEEGQVPSVTGWEKSVNASSPDSTTHTARVTFTADGDYTFELTAKDKAGNGAEAYPQDKFVIDKTNPVIEIGFDKNSGENGNYYGETRTATVIIKEHNFESSRVRIKGMNAKEENSTFPSIGSFQTQGDVHQAALEFSEDGQYSFEASYTDKAGNEAEVVKTEAFHIDTTEPEISFEGVEYHGAYRKEVAPVISCKDENMDSNSLKTELRIVNLEGSTVINPVKEGEVTTSKDSCRLQMASPEHTKEQDGIYHLDVEIKDLAGNLHTETLEYSVNRFGSVYTLDSEAKKAAGNYVKSTDDIEILETNADELHQTQVKLTKNGEIRELKAGEDYQIKESKEEGSWKQYRYVINKENFKEDGVYMITLSSKDKAGNTNENTAQEKDAEVWFGVDNTSPVIVPLNVIDNGSYDLTEMEVQVEVQDNLKLETVKCYVNDTEIETKQEETRQYYTFRLAESSKAQNLRIVATDAAGNELVREIKGVYITTNPLIRFIHNKTAVAATSTVAAVVILLGMTLIMMLKKKAKIREEQVQK